ncbi:MAG: DnaJ C-terminal domain-containing protein [Acidobacteriota bacterium]
MEYKDYYKLLGVDKKATQDEISKAFKKLARTCHPDLNPGDCTAEAKFKEINEAYEVLRDPEKRKLYDTLGPNWQHGQNFQPPPGYENFRYNFGGAGQGGQQFDMGGFSDFLQTIYGGSGGMGGRGGFGGQGGFGAQGGFGGQGFQRRPTRGGDVEALLELTLEEAYHGGSKTVTIQEEALSPDGRPYIRPKTLSVNIPAGVRDGSKIRLAGQGEQGGAGGSAGDMYLKVSIRPHSRFKLEDVNVLVDVPLAPWEAALGATVRVPTLDGDIDLNIPAGSSSGRKMRIRGKGLQGKAGRGDQFVRVMIHTPKTLTDAERALWHDLAEASSFNPREHH